MQRLAPRTIALVTAVLAAAALGVAYGSEIWGGLVPCALCLVERWPYRIVVVLGLVAAVSPPGLGRVLLAGAVLVLLAGAATAAVHAGVELHWWPSPLPECAAPHIGGASLADRLASMPDRPSKPCDDPTFLVPGLPVSMAAMNTVFALVFAVTLAISLLTNRSRR